jgi:ABC-type Fe3+-hydroxamate transport system substrate-binding protein
MGAGVQVLDDLGLRVELAAPPARVVSLVPSWTETLFALGVGPRVAGVTRFCVEPAAEVATLAKVGGTKNPDLGAIMRLSPDLVIANAEENRREDIDRLREYGIPVFVTYPRTVPGAVESVLRLGSVLGAEHAAAGLTREIVMAVSEIEAGLGVWMKLRLRVFCPVWKNPWMTFNADTYAHDVLRMLGFRNIFAAAGERYPRVTLQQALEERPDVVLLPDEPYLFTDDDVREMKEALPAALGRRVLLINGRDLHWYGAHMVRGLRALNQLLARVRATSGLGSS